MRRRFKRPRRSDKCGKTEFRNEIAAKLAISKIAANSSELKIPSRAYRCNVCRYWHLTSKPG